MASLGETLAGAYDPMGNFTGGSTPVQYPSSGASVPASVQSSNVNDYWGALARLPVKAAMALPDLAQDYGAWRTGIPADKPYSTQAEDALMAHGFLPQRTGSEWDQKGDTVASMGSSVMPGPGEAASLAKMLGGAAGASKAISVPFALAKKLPFDAGKVEQMLQTPGLTEDAWRAGRTWKDGIAGAHMRPDGLPAIDTADYQTRIATGKLQSQLGALNRDIAAGNTTFTQNIPSSELARYARPFDEIVSGPVMDQVPDLKNWGVVAFPKRTDGVLALANPDRKLIGLGADANGAFDRERSLNDLMHETQHAVDHIGQDAGLPIYTTGSNPRMFSPGDMRQTLNQAATYSHNTGDAHAATLASYLRDLLMHPNPEHRAYTLNGGEALARVAGESALDKEFLKYTPEQRMPLLYEGAVSPHELHFARGSANFQRGMDAIKAGSPNPLRGLFPGQ